MHCVVAGAGYVGVTTALVLVEKGHSVNLVDVDESRASRIAAGEVPFVEPGVETALRSALATGRLSASTDLVSAVASADAVFVCVGTPARPNGEADLSFVKDASKMIGQGLRRTERSPLVVVKSTVPPGTTKELVVPEVEKAGRKKDGEGFFALSNPEFLREGRALLDARKPDRIVIGGTNADAIERLAKAWEAGATPLVKTDATTAELIKYASNAFLALKISFANEVANLAARIGVDVYDVMDGIGLDPRIGSQFLRAGAGFGGSCLPKDVSALDRFARKQGYKLRLARDALDINEEQPVEVVRLAEEALGGLKGKAIALLGLAFKPDTDDVRESRAIPIYRALVEAGAKVTVWDPAALENFKRAAGGTVDGTRDLRAAMLGKDAAVLQTEWKELRELPARSWKERLAHPIVVDGRRSVDAAALEKEGIRYFAIGRPRPKA